MPDYVLLRFVVVGGEARERRRASSRGNCESVANSESLGEGSDMSADDNTCECGTTKYPWAGPAFFTAVLVAVIVFFVWFLRA